MSDELGRFFGTLNQRLEDERQAEQRALERFFVELGPRLETARTLERERDRKLAPRFNVFDYLRTDELGLSKMIGDLLDPAGSHGQGAAFLQCLTERLGFAKNCNLSRSKVKVDVELTIKSESGEERRIDIAVQIDDAHGNKYCLAIESKANFAVDQPAQGQDYLWWLKKHYRSKHLLVYLTPTGEGPSEDSVSGDSIEKLKREAPRRLVIMPCGPSGKLDDTFNDLRLSFSLADWLADCRRGCDVDRLRWFLREAETFCQRRYGGTAVTTTESSTVKDFVLAHPESIATALAVYQSWPAIEAQIKSDFMELIRNKLDNDADLPEDIKVDYIFGEGKHASYIEIYRNSWRPQRDSEGQEWNTTICLAAESNSDTEWSIGVSSVSTDEEYEGRHQRLQDDFAKYSKQYRTWAWWEWIKDEYRYWDALLPRLHEEYQAGGGEIANYFVKKFKDVFKWAAPIIDGIDRL